MVAKPVDITVEQNSTLRVNVGVTVSDEDLTPVSLSGYTAQMQIRTHRGAVDALATYTTEDGTITIDAAGGLVMIEVPDEDTALYDWTTAVYDLYVISPAGKRYRVAQGKALLDETVST